MKVKSFGVLVAMLIASSLYADKGEIVFEKGDHYVVDTGRGCSVVEWYGGGISSESDKVVGDLNSYGFKDIYNQTTGKEIRVYIDDYFLNEDDAIERIYELEG